MRHRVKNKRLSKATDQRMALLRSLARGLFINGRIITSEGRAKEARRYAEKLITLAREGTLPGIRKIRALLGEVKIDVARFEGRPGGYTRITKIGARRGDGAPRVILELI